MQRGRRAHLLASELELLRLRCLQLGASLGGLLLLRLFELDGQLLELLEPVGGGLDGVGELLVVRLQRREVGEVSMEEVVVSMEEVVGG